MKKALFYLSFSALGLFFAEVVSANFPFALFNPILYLVYGPLYCLFIDHILRKRRADFHIIYLLGALIGFITETYTAKVIFWGLSPAGKTVFGFSPVAVLFIILFYHAYFSFLAPLYFATRVLKFQTAVTVSRFNDILLLAAPVFLSPVIASILISRHSAPAEYILKSFLSFSVLSIILLFFKKSCPSVEPALSSTPRRTLIIIAVLLNLFFIFNITNFEHGHAPLDFPMRQMICVTFFILALLMALSKVEENKESGNPVVFTADINFRMIFAWFVYHYSVLAILLYFFINNRNYIAVFIGPLALTGILTGISSFLYSMYKLIRYEVLK
jgi:hypothetical protein